MFNPLDLTGRAILVTGASSGIGRETSVYLSRLGARVILVGRSEERLQQTHSLLTGNGHFVAPFDLTNVDGIPLWMKSLACDHGVLSGVVHSAGLHDISPLRVQQPSRLDDLMKVNVTAALFLTKGLRQRGVRADCTSVVYIASVMALAGQPGVAAYSATKGALVSMARSLALELAPEGIRINCIAPGHVSTEMTGRSEALMTDEQIEQIERAHPLGIGAPQDVAAAVAFLLAETGRWITGQTLAVDGGYTAA